MDAQAGPVSRIEVKFANWMEKHNFEPTTELPAAGTADQPERLALLELFFDEFPEEEEYSEYLHKYATYFFSVSEDEDEDDDLLDEDDDQSQINEDEEDEDFFDDEEDDDLDDFDDQDDED